MIRLVVPAVALLLVASPIFAQSASSTEEEGTLGPSIFLSIDGKQAYRVSDWLGAPVRLKSGDGIGEIESLILGPDGQTVAAIIGVGGFLGIGERTIAVDIASLRASREDGDVVLDLDATREEVENAEPVIFE